MSPRPLGSAASRRRWISGRMIAVGAACLGIGLAAAPARAEFGLEPGSFRADTYNPDTGRTETQAGRHPTEAITAFRFNMIPNAVDPRKPKPDGGVRDINVRLPHGFLGNPEAAAKCARADFGEIVSGIFGVSSCPISSQVGVARIITAGYVGLNGINNEYPIYNLEPAPGQIADFGIPVLTVPAHMWASVDAAADYRLVINAEKISQGLPIAEMTITLWGVPAARRHDFRRACNGGGQVFRFLTPCSITSPPKPFLTNPTDCSMGPAKTDIAVASWQEPGVWKRDSYMTASAPTGCEQLRFEPRITVRSDSQRAGTPSGYTVDIDIPQNDDPGALGTPPMRDAIVTMPPGTVMSPPSADGLLGCDDSEFGYRSTSEVICPAASKVASATVTTPVLPGPLVGEVFLGRPLPGDLVRLFMVLRYPGLEFKIPGRVARDQQTGQLTATFDENPPFPFSNLRLRFKGGPRAALVNPSTCGPATATGSFTAYGVDTPAVSTSTIDITQTPDGRPCAAETFSPSFVAGVMNPVAGASSPLVATFARADQDQKFRSMTVEMPEGLTGRIALADLCSDVQASAGTCGAESRIGNAITSAGQGPNPFTVNGRVYITGPYKGAPFGMSIVVPVVAGPFDLGTVVVRAAVHIDRNNARLSIIADPLPTILDGFPLQIRKVTIKVDRPGFILAPTSCARKSIGAQIQSVAGAIANVSSRFQVGNCAGMPFRPSMSLKIGARGRTRPGITVPFQTVVKMPPGQSNIRSVRVNLPDNINARLPVINRNSCSLAVYQAGRCPESLAIGTATATTPLLRDPLRGKAYFVRNPARRIPDLVVALKGQVDIDVTGKVTIPRDLTLATTFDTVPDVPITKFTLNLVAGRSGPIGTIGNLCSARVRAGMSAKLLFRGQNGRAISRLQKMQIAGCGRAGRTTRRAASKKR